MEQESKTETTFIPRVRVEAGTAMYFDPETLKVYDSLTGQYIGGINTFTNRKESTNQ